MQRLVSVVFLLLAFVLAPAAMAQDEDMIRPISRAHIKDFSKLLELNDEQVQVVEMLHQGYMQALQRENVKMREAMEKAQEAFNFEGGGNFDQEAMMEAQKVMASSAINHIKTNLRLQEELFADMRSMLEPEQVEVFPRVERMRRRQMILSEMQIAWAQVDLVDCLQTLELSSELSSDFDEALIRYELAIDRYLMELMAFMMDMIERGPEMMLSPDMEEQQKMMETVFGAMHSMRTANKEHARKLGSLMSEPDRERFDHETRFRAFPQVYRESDTTQALSVAVGLGDLSGDQPERINAIRAQYSRELENSNTLWAAAIDEEADDIDMESMMMAMMGGEETESDRARKARHELDQKFRDRLEAVLTVEQIERLPERRGIELTPMEQAREAAEQAMEEAMKQIEAGGGG